MREMQKAVVHFLDGSVLRARLRFFEGTAAEVTGEDLAGQPLSISLERVKAIFFVHRYEGLSPDELPTPVPEPSRGKVVSVRFPDGEVIEGLVNRFSPRSEGFYLTPVPPGGNNRVLFVPASSPREITGL